MDLLKRIACLLGLLYIATRLFGLDTPSTSWESPGGLLVAVVREVDHPTLPPDKTNIHRPWNRRLPPLPRMPADTLDALRMIQQARGNKRATFVQIGANDGQMFDPLFPHFQADPRNKELWIGLQAEPQPQLYGALAVLHADAPDWSFYLGAVATPQHCVHGRIEFCETKTPGQGDWTTQGQVNRITAGDSCPEQTMHLVQRPCVTSLDELIYRHASPEYLRHAMETTNTDYLGEQRIYNIDFLQIDVEGKDYDILQMIDWKQLHPTCIAYEQSHLNDNKQLAQDLMKQMGYTIIEGAMDVLACQVMSR